MDYLKQENKNKRQNNQGKNSKEIKTNQGMNRNVH